MEFQKNGNQMEFQKWKTKWNPIFKLYFLGPGWESRNQNLGPRSGTKT